MGYTTEFTGSISLGRKLTIVEAKELLEIADGERGSTQTGIDAYFQWVPADTLEHIVWDGGKNSTNTKNSFVGFVTGCANGKSQQTANSIGRAKKLATQAR